MSERQSVNSQDRRAPPRRQYPPLYEKVVPIALGAIVLGIIVLLVIILTVALGLLPGTR